MVAMYLLVSKCAVLIRYRDQNSVIPAPYLDKHGESDIGLR